MATQPPPPARDAAGPGTGTGLILGKFMPPHLGHQYLVEFGRHYAARLHVLVCSLEREPIPGRLRAGWMRELFPDAVIHHHTAELPQEPHEHPRFWDLWRTSIRDLVPEPLDFVFASEPYGERLAAELGASFVPVDLARELVPVSGTQIREAPLLYWDFLPPVVRPYFVKRVCVFGPESTGKTTLTRQLADYYGTVGVAEYARGLLDCQDGRCELADIPRIARGQIASEEALARQANRVMICDTDVLTTTIWSDVLFGDCPAWIRDEADRRHYDLTLLLDTDVPWVADGQRYFPNARESFMARCVKELQKRERPYVRIRGGWEARFDQAVAAIDALLEAG